MVTLEEVWGLLKVIEAKLDAKTAASASSAPTGGGKVATDYEMSGQYGDPVVKKDPKRWTGDSFAGCKMSECPPEYLDELASLYDWMGDKDDEAGKTWSKPGGEPRAASSFKRKDAALARGWAARKRAGGGKSDAGKYANGHLGSAKHALPPEKDDAGAFDTQTGELFSTPIDDIPFVSSIDASAPHVRMPRWERF